VLATALATPCTAPFLSIALGFAFAQGAGVILLVFSMVAAGLASPYILLTWNPAWLKFLPRPGAWMEKFKMAMAFPMFLTAVWLFSLAADNYSGRAVWLGIFLVLVALAFWIYGEFVQRGRKHHLAAGLMAAAVLVLACIFILENQLHWRTPVVTSANHSNQNPDDIAWQPWSSEAVAQARAAGRPILVDFTADWCLTCQVNKKTSIETAVVREKIKAGKIVALHGDYTHFPDDITSELNRFKRAGVPLVLVYPKDAAAPPIVLPEVLTPNIVLDALDQATK
jgi:thiol:disulfide interchange protein DsbD